MLLLRIAVLLCQIFIIIAGVGNSNIFSPSTTIPSKFSLKSSSDDHPIKGDDGKLVDGVISGVLENGLTYKILNRKGRLLQNNNEVSIHLEVLAGSADESNSQQGMAHLLEHVLHSANNERQVKNAHTRPLNPSIRTNAYADFHHSVYNIDGVANDASNIRNAIHMVSEVLDMSQWADPVMAPLLHSLVAKEKAIVESEAAVIHTINDGRYAVDAQLLGVLHKENVLSKRFPIGGAGDGQGSSFASWNAFDLRAFHRQHYRPANTVLYIAGDVGDERAVEETIRAIEQAFGGIASTSTSTDADTETDDLDVKSRHQHGGGTMKAVSKYFPPVQHIWSTNQSTLISSNSKFYYPVAAVKRSAGYSIRRRLIDDVLHPKGTLSVASPSSPTNATARKLDILTLSLPTPVMIKGPASSPYYELHIFAKKPITSVRTAEDFKQYLYQRVIHYVLKSRLASHQHNITSCTQLSFDEGQNCPREGCKVQTLCVKALDSKGLLEGVRAVVQELRRVSNNEFTTWHDVVRYVRMVLSEVEEEQLARQFKASARELGEGLMESSACGDTYMMPEETMAQCRSLLYYADEGVANAVAKEMCEHLCAPNFAAGIVPHSIVVVTPPTPSDSHSHSVGSAARTATTTADGADSTVQLTAEDVMNTLVQALGSKPSESIRPLAIFPTPRKLYHRKNTIIRLWRMLSPKYEQAPRRKTVPLRMRGGWSHSLQTSGTVAPRSVPVSTRAAIPALHSGDRVDLTSTTTATEIATGPEAEDEETDNEEGEEEEEEDDHEDQGERAVSSGVAIAGRYKRSHLTPRQQLTNEYRSLVQPNYEENVDIEQNRLVKNGLFVNFAATGVEPNRVAVELKIPGGLSSSPRHAPLLMSIGSKLIQHGTSMGRRARETIEFFCLERKISVQVIPKWDCLLIRFSAPAKTIGLERYHRNNGLEMILQLVRGIIQQSDYHYDQQSFDKVIAQLTHEFRHPAARGLVHQCHDAILQRVAGSAALASVRPHSESDLQISTLPKVEALMKQQLSKLQRYNPGAVDHNQHQMELTIAGNLTLGRMREHVVRILGTVISAEQLDALIGVNGTVKPSRKVLRRRQQQRLKENYLLSANFSEHNNLDTNPSTSGMARSVTGKTKRPLSEEEKLEASKANRTPFNNRHVSFDADDADDADDASSGLRVQWSDNSPIFIHSTSKSSGSSSGSSAGMVPKSIGFVVGPAYNKHGMLCDGSSVVQAQSHNMYPPQSLNTPQYPYLPPTPQNKGPAGSAPTADTTLGSTRMNTQQQQRQGQPLHVVEGVRKRLHQVLSAEEQARLDIYLRRLLVVRNQDRYDHTAISSTSASSSTTITSGSPGSKGSQDSPRAIERDRRRMQSHPAYVEVMSLLLEEIMNRKLYAHVRDELALAYDVSFHLESLDSSVLMPLPDSTGAGTRARPGTGRGPRTGIRGEGVHQQALTGGWYQIEVHSDSDKLPRAIKACRDVVKTAASNFDTSGGSRSYGNSNKLSVITTEDVDTAVRAVQEHILRKERFSLDYWIAKLSGSQMSNLYTGMVTVNKEKLLKSITADDVVAWLRRMEFGTSGKEFIVSARG